MLLKLLHHVGKGRARALNERGIALWERGQLEDAERALRGALRRDPNHAGAASNLGMVLAGQARMDEAITALRSAVDMDPRHAGAHVNLAAILRQGGAIPEAVGHLREALALEPGNRTARANLVRPLMELCDWDAVASVVATLRDECAAGVAGWADAIAPFESQVLPFTPEFQLCVGRHHSARYEIEAGRGGRIAPRSAAPSDTAKRLRIGYLSSDFHEHATAHLSAGLYAAHDRRQFEIIAYSIGRGEAGAYRQRIVAGCDAFNDVAGLPAGEIARRIARDGVDILVDMAGYAGGGRPQIPALRPAPLQVSFLGYPGTMGAAFMDYLIADRVVIPREMERWYAEKLVFMPGSYQVNDGGQAIAATIPSRDSLGLPDEAFVFCCFNQLYKMEPATFAAWMRILEAVPGSVLWLQSGHVVAEQRLRSVAAAAGVDAARLVFAAYAPKPDHLARHAHAGLFLDTHAVNAHTTASDALWAGVPLLTWPGDTFSSRVAASLLHAVGLADCVMPDLRAYEARAVSLATNPQALAAVRARLNENRLTHSLFDTKAYAKSLETAYRGMWTQHCKGAAPVSFDVA